MGSVTFETAPDFTTFTVEYMMLNTTSEDLPPPYDNLPSYHTVVECKKFIVIFLRSPKSSTVQLSKKTCTLQKDHLDIALCKWQLDIEKATISRFDDKLTIIIPKTKKVGIFGNRFRFSTLYKI